MLNGLPWTKLSLSAPTMERSGHQQFLRLVSPGQCELKAKGRRPFQGLEARAQSAGRSDDSSEFHLATSAAVPATGYEPVRGRQCVRLWAERACVYCRSTSSFSIGMHEACCQAAVQAATEQRRAELREDLQLREQLDTGANMPPA
eukprot:6180930-Pleurochrysis_carterae.AAC.6